MSDRARALADRFEQVNNEVIRAVESFSDAQWRATCTGETWSVGVTAHHLAGAHQAIAGVAQAIGTGQELPLITMEMIDQGNAQHAKDFANCTKQETLDLLRSGGAAAAGMVRGLSDEQLDRSAPLMGGPLMTAEQVIENILIGHTQQHFNSIQAAAGS